VETRPSIVGGRFQIDKSSTDGIWSLNRRSLGNLAYKAMIPPLSPGNGSETAPSQGLKVRRVNKQPLVMHRSRIRSDGPLSHDTKHASRRVRIEKCPSSRCQILGRRDIAADFDLAVVPRLWKLVLAINGNVRDAGNIVQVQDRSSVCVLNNEQQVLVQEYNVMVLKQPSLKVVPVNQKVQKPPTQEFDGDS